MIQFQVSELWKWKKNWIGNLININYLIILTSYFQHNQTFKKLISLELVSLQRTGFVFRHRALLLSPFASNIADLIRQNLLSCNIPDVDILQSTHSTQMLLSWSILHILLRSQTTQSRLFICKIQYFCFHLNKFNTDFPLFLLKQGLPKLLHNGSSYLQRKQLSWGLKSDFGSSMSASLCSRFLNFILSTSSEGIFIVRTWQIINATICCNDNAQYFSWCSMTLNYNYIYKPF